MPPLQLPPCWMASDLSPSCCTWIPGPYNSRFSNLCSAAVHSGVISNAGGVVLVHLYPGLSSYKGAQHGASTVIGRIAGQVLREAHNSVRMVHPNA